MLRAFNVLLAVFAFLSIRAQADDFSNAQDEIDGLVQKELLKQQIKTACGVTRQQMPIVAMLDSDALKLRGPKPDGTPKTRVLLIGGLDGNRDSSLAVLKAWHNFYNDGSAKLRAKIALAAVPFGNPEAMVNSSDDRKPKSLLNSFPPKGKAYGDADIPEAIYLWRWIGMLGPDVVVMVSAHGEVAWTSNGSIGFPTSECRTGSFSHALKTGTPLNVGSVLAVDVAVDKAGENWCKQLLSAVAGLPEKSSTSAAHKELIRRTSRSPLQTAQELTKTYGHSLPSVAYIPALALLGRLRVGELDGDGRHAKDVQKIVAPFIDGPRQALGKRVSGSTLSGHLIFSELARRTGNKKYFNLAKAAADLGFDDSGKLKQSMPFHSEMSDAVFMGTPILVQTGLLADDSKYFDMADRHLRFMMKLNLRKDGLHQHSPLDKSGTAWGRGNGFVALGLALSLSDLPKNSRHRPFMLKAYQEHIAAMIKHQDEMGMWHQVVDHPESYRELTVTCMTTFAIVRGVRNGWLDRESYLPVIRKAWHGISRRIGPDGVLVDVCTGTGKQRSFRDYLDRPAIFGKDARGGAMALMVTTELAAAELP
jgi:rhamnogalacturonyl hydrolase YesR